MNLKKKSNGSSTKLLFGFFRIVPRRERLTLILAILVTLISSLLDVLAVSMLYPLSQVLSGRTSITPFPFLQFDFEFSTSRQAVLTVLGVISFFYILRTGTTVIARLIDFRQARRVTTDVSKRLLEISLAKPIANHEVERSSDSFRSIENSHHVVRYGLIPFRVLISELFLIVALFLVIAFTVPGSMLAGILLMLCSIGLYGLVTSRQVQRISRNRESLNLDRTFLATTILSAKHEIDVYRVRKRAVNKFSEIESRYNNADFKNQVIGEISSPIIECISIISIATSIYLFLTFNGQPELLLPSLTLLVGAGMRILPSAARVSAAINNLSFGSASLLTIENLLKQPILTEYELFEDRTRNLTLIFDQLSFQYSDSNARLINSSDIRFPTTGLVGLYGRSGSGKTTLLNLISGYEKPTRGSIYFTGSGRILSPTQVKIGYVPQEICVLNATLLENIIFFRELDLHEGSLEKLMDLVFLGRELETIDSRLFKELGDGGSTLSGGQRRRLGLARALVDNPDLLLLDEPTVGLEAELEFKLIDLINTLSRTSLVIVASHSAEVLKRCDTLLTIDENGYLTLLETQVGDAPR